MFSLRPVKGKAVLLCGPEGSGKALLARAMAVARGSFDVTSMDVFMTHAGFQSVLRRKSETVIIEQFTGSEPEMVFLKSLIPRTKQIVGFRGGNPVYAASPSFIITSGHKDALKLGEYERRFTVVEL